MDAGKGVQLFLLAKDFFDHHIEGTGVLSPRVADQAAQALKILRGVAQAVDVVEPQSLQLSVRDQLLDQTMDGREGAGILHAQAGQRIDVEETAIIDVAGGKPPMAELVVLAFEQMVQCQRLRRAAGAGAIGGKSARDDLGAAGDIFQFRLEGGCLLAVGMAQSRVAQRKFENSISRLARLGAGFLHDDAQYLAVTFGRDRQPVLEIPAGEAAFARVVAEFDLAALERFAVGRAEDRQQHPAPGAVGQLLPIDVEGGRVRRGRPPFQHVEPPGIVGEMHADMVGDEVEDEAEVVLLAAPRSTAQSRSRRRAPG